MIELKQVSFAYGNGERDSGLEDIELKVEEGEFLLLCGGSGCGKTTLTRLLNGLIPNFYGGVLKGQVWVGGLDVAKAPLYETAGKVGSVFQNPRSQFFNMDTTGELAFGCENMGLPLKEICARVERIALELGLEPLLDRNIFALSGGEKQKIACGAVAALGPQVYVLDEPSSNLDALAIEELRALLTKLKAQGKTVIIAEHRLYYLRELVDRVIYMKKGRIQQEYSGQEFRALPRGELDAMGLRSLSLEGLLEGAPVHLPRTEGAIALSGFSFAYPRGGRSLDIRETSFPQGAVVAVTGHNGAGKSTLARCLCGLEKKCRGRMGMQGESLGRKERLKRSYMVMQDVNHQLFTESVLDEVLISMGHRDVKQGEEILKGLDLLQFKERHPMSLSGGQKQRVAIASAIASRRELILFDEPTSGLDLLHMQGVARSLSQLAGIGKSVLVVTHDPEFILSCCTHILHMQEGKIIDNRPLDACGRGRMLSYFLEAVKEPGERRERVV